LRSSYSHYSPAIYSVDHSAKKKRSMESIISRKNRTSRKALASESIVILILILVSFILILMITQSAGEWLRLITGKQTCLVSSTLSDVVAKIGINIGVKCTTKYYPSLTPVSQELADVPEGTLDDFHIFAESIYDCWDQFGKGKVNAFKAGVGDSDTYCYVCARFKYADTTSDQTQDTYRQSPLEAEQFIQRLSDMDYTKERVSDLGIILNAFPQEGGNPVPFVVAAGRKQLDAQDVNIPFIPEFAEKWGISKMRTLNVARYNEFTLLQAGSALEPDHDYAIVFWTVPAEVYQQTVDFLKERHIPMGALGDAVKKEPEAHVIIVDTENLHQLGCDHIYAN
jgi:hypothetical protein